MNVKEVFVVFFFYIRFKSLVRITDIENLIVIYIVFYCIRIELGLGEFIFRIGVVNIIKIKIYVFVL